MIKDQIEKIETKVQDTKSIPEETRSQLLGLLSDLKSEIDTLAKTHAEDARSIAKFADVSTQVATRTEKKPQLVDAALSGLTASVEGFESTHSNLTQVVNRLAVVLSNMGI
jgi:chromosome segregation ATPase